MDTTLARRPIGHLIDGRYRVESHLADGGMATIYLGTDTRLDRTVALKIMRPEYANDEDFVRRFVAEARSVAQLSHPNVVTVYDQGADGRTLYLAMEYVPGRNLRALLREQGRLHPAEALDIMEGVLGGLAAAHDAGIAHRDVKPENVLLTDSRQIKVADFGLARVVTGTSHTKSGMLIGTAAYLAPEQVSGGLADARADVYAAGIMLFELLTGRQPHTGSDPLSVAYKHVNEVVPPPSSLAPGLPPALDTLVAMATSRDPELRPQDAGQFLGAITGVRHTIPDPGLADPRALRDAHSQGRGAPGYAATPPHGSAMPGTAAAGWTDPRSATDPGRPAGAHDDTPAAGVVIPPSAWDSAPRGEFGHDLVPGMALTPCPPSDGPSSGREDHQPTQWYQDDSYRPPGNKTLIVSAGPGPDYAPPPGRYRSIREPGLQRLLFSRRLAYLAAAIAAVIVIAGLAWWQTAGRYRAVPSVTGLTVADARSELSGVGFTVAVGKREVSNTVVKGDVIGTIPASGSSLATGSKIALIVSTGPRMISMPQVTGQPVADAEAALRHAGLRIGPVKPETSATIPAGVVLSTRPAAGTSWPQPQPVELIVSAGPPVPNFVGQPKQVAESWASANGVALNEVNDSNSTAPPGTVIRQSVPPGSAFTPHEVITITISAPNMVPIPNVQGMQTQQAVHTLQQLGFKVQIVKQGPFSIVANYSPTGQAPAGSTITLYVGLGGGGQSARPGPLG